MTTLHDGFDARCGKPVYYFTWIDYFACWDGWSDSDGLLLAVGEKLCVTPPVIPQPEETT